MEPDNKFKIDYNRLSGSTGLPISVQAQLSCENNLMKMLYAGCKSAVELPEQKYKK